jgi:hypothetical protein
MKNPADYDGLGALAIKDDVPSLFNAAALRFDRIANASDARRFRNAAGAFLNLSHVAQGLDGTPFSNCVSRDGFQIRKRKAGELDAMQRLPFPPLIA